MLIGTARKRWLCQFGLDAPEGKNPWQRRLFELCLKTKEDWAMATFELLLNSIGNVHYKGRALVTDEVAESMAMLMIVDEELRGYVMGAWRLAGHQSAREILVQSARHALSTEAVRG